ncbi:MAG: 16S rRNA (cytosine(1402)-N(4))-methyltransferase RsmH [Deltaproteobacteria bacterium]|nr:MAG: 16S rRNA (cytosine(1402)-N(4))-methyltransferase RsmH [Deltaproteobacteria bacterium]TMB28708.1 MAG: 16S rRNA (cytosine(1402)-N(4))-methyltransferase RsmH [Deltaproteobacteria bacterium]
MEFSHRPVLLRETVELLAPDPGKLFLDGTLGGGGHAAALLEAGARVIGLDQDPRALDAARTRLAKYGDRFVAEHANFRDAAAVLARRGIPEVDGALVDLGVSSAQLDDAGRGFSFQRQGPLDMRMDSTRGTPLAERLAGWDEKELEGILRDLGEERFARPIARRVLSESRGGALTDTAKLAETVASAIPRRAWPRGIHPATRTFQALRIAVNDELGALSDFLAALPRIVSRGGRAAAIAFHSLEDRMVKQSFARLATGCICPPDLPVCGCGRTAAFRLLTRKAVKASASEESENPRSRSARLRAVERLS